jgi:hypothetical protein
MGFWVRKLPTSSHLGSAPLLFLLSRLFSDPGHVCIRWLYPLSCNPSFLLNEG